jgi:hypothetical protein
VKKTPGAASLALSATGSWKSPAKISDTPSPASSDGARTRKVTDVPAPAG